MSHVEFGIQINPKHFLVGTLHLSAKEIGAWALLAAYLSRKGHLPKQNDKLAKIARLSLREWREVRSDIFEALQGDFWGPSSRVIGQRRAIPIETRQAVMDRDGERCVYCGNDSGPFHLDHIVPWSKGGTDDADNLCVACGPCNLSKSAKTPDEWSGRQ